jgi:flavin reductase (DIM6/NTAB) family NADH-FMN oxidoreductase RutF
MSTNLVSQVLKKLHYGIYIVTSRKDGSELTTRNADWVSASTISWVTQVSMDPDRLAVVVRKNSNLAETIQRSQNFAVHLLSEDEREVVSKFDGQVDFSDDEVNGFSFREGSSGAPILDIGLGFVDCELSNAITLEGDHLMFVGKPLSAELNDDEAKVLALDETRFEYGG